MSGIIIEQHLYCRRAALLLRAEALSPGEVCGRTLLRQNPAANPSPVS
jgi:hypothetical protein